MYRIDSQFEKISKYTNDEAVILPSRSTAESAGYDFYAAEDTVIPPYATLYQNMSMNSFDDDATNLLLSAFLGEERMQQELKGKVYSMEEAAALIKKSGAKITLVPTGVKCKIPKGWFLQLSARSSTPLKHWLIVGNSVGVIDSDYYNNPDNEGHIYFQIINLSPVPIKIAKGEKFGQGILMNYGVTSNDTASEKRVGGFGSTSGQK